MRSFTWNRFPIKIVIDSLLKSPVEWSYLLTVLVSCHAMMSSCLLLCLQRLVAILASGWFCCCSLLRNNNMATSLQRFTSSYGGRCFAACDCWSQTSWRRKCNETVTADSGKPLSFILCEKKHEWICGNWESCACWNFCPLPPYTHKKLKNLARSRTAGPANRQTPALFPSQICTSRSGVTIGLSQGVQNIAEGGPLANTQRKLRKDSESEYHGCLYQLKKENTQKTQKTPEIKRMLNTKMSAKGGPVLHLACQGGNLLTHQLCHCCPEKTLKTHATCFTASGNLFCGSFQNQWKFFKKTKN